MFWLAPFVGAEDIYILITCDWRESMSQIIASATSPESQIVNDKSATFDVIVNSVDPIVYQWQRNEWTSLEQVKHIHSDNNHAG